MGRRGRFGKYGEIKRHDRLRQARIKPPFRHGSDAKPPKSESFLRKPPDKRTSPRIRLAKATDADFIVHLSRKVFNIYGPYDDIVSGWFESGRTLTLIAVLGKKPVGFAMIGYLSNERSLEHVSELLAIAVEPEKQGMGIGQTLIGEIEKKATEVNVKRLILHTAQENLPAQNLFTRNGYHPWGIKRHFYPAGQDAVMMTKEIRERVR